MRVNPALIIKTLQKNNGAVRATARELGISSGTIINWRRRAGDTCEAARVNSDKRVWEPGGIFLNHTLAIAELYVRLRTMIGINLPVVEFEPVCWRGYVSEYGINATLKPDLYAVTAYGKFEDSWFFEIDLNTEAPIRVMRKCESYILYYLTEVEQRLNGVFPRVTWIVPDEKRRETIKRYIEENHGDYTDLFTVIVLDKLESLIRCEKVVV